MLRPSTPTSIICLGRLRIAYRYIFNLWKLCQGVDSLAQWLEHWIFNWEDQVQFPRKAGNFFSYASFLRYNFHVVRLCRLSERLTSTGAQTFVNNWQLLFSSQQKQVNGCRNDLMINLHEIYVAELVGEGGWGGGVCVQLLWPLDSQSNNIEPCQINSTLVHVRPGPPKQ